MTYVVLMILLDVVLMAVLLLNLRRSIYVRVRTTDLVFLAKLAKCAERYRLAALDHVRSEAEIYAGRPGWSTTFHARLLDQELGRWAWLAGWTSSLVERLRKKAGVELCYCCYCGEPIAGEPSMHVPPPRLRAQSSPRRPAAVRAVRGSGRAEPGRDLREARPRAR